jgi:hypothetical protein
MKTYKQTQSFRKLWSRVSRSSMWAGVIGTVIGSIATAAILGAFSTVEKILTHHALPAPVEHATVSGGTWGPSRILYRCMPNGRCLAPDSATLDSQLNDPAVGNEAYFMTARLLAATKLCSVESMFKLEIPCWYVRSSRTMPRRM